MHCVCGAFYFLTLNVRSDPTTPPSASTQATYRGELMMNVMMVMASNRQVMTEEFTLSPWLMFMGWLTTAMMIAAVIGMLATWGKA